MSARGQFSCFLQFSDVWRASLDETDALLRKMMTSLSGDGVSRLSFSGDLGTGSLQVTFMQPDDASPTTDLFRCVELVVKALNSGRVSAPGWPNDEVIDGAITSVAIKGCSLAAA